MMKCPYCGMEMQAGYIPGGCQPVQWLPEGNRPPLFHFAVAEHGVALANQFEPLKANGYRAQAHYCSNCRIVLAPIKDG